VKHLIAAIAGFCLAVFSMQSVAASDHGTLQEAEALLKKAVAHYDKVGREKALSDLARNPGPFVDRDLYVTVYDMKGISLAHINPKQVGKDMLELRDPDGKYIVKERLEAARTKPDGYIDYKFFNPVSKKIEPKRAYWQRHGDLLFTAGAYKVD
jgi:cytochrome c